MKNIKNINPIEIAFHYFVDDYPESFNPKDRTRFYEFINTLNRYRKDGKKWFGKDYFIKRLSEYVSPECAKAYYSTFVTINDYLFLKPALVNRAERHFFDDSGTISYEIRFIKDGKLFIKTVDRESFDKTRSLKKASELS